MDPLNLYRDIVENTMEYTRIPVADPVLANEADEQVANHLRVGEQPFVAGVVVGHAGLAVSQRLPKKSSLFFQKTPLPEPPGVVRGAGGIGSVVA